MEQVRTLNTNRAAQVLDAVQGIVRAYVFIWGSPEHVDSYGTWFDKANPPEYSAMGELRGYPVCYEHGMDSSYGKSPVGYITRTEFDDYGLAADIQLDRSHPMFERTVAEIATGILKTSSSSADHMAVWREDHSFQSWMMTELSFTPSPAEYEMPSAVLVRSDAEVVQDAPRADEPIAVVADMALDTSEPVITVTENLTNTQPEASIERNEVNAMDLEPALQQAMQSGMVAGDVVSALLAAGFSAEELMTALEPQDQQNGENEMSNETMPPEQRSTLIADVLAALKAQKEEEAKANEIETLRAEIAALKAEQNAAPEVPAVRHANGGNDVQVSVSEPRKFWGKSADDLLFGHMVMRAKGWTPTDEYMKAMAARAAEATRKEQGQFVDPAVRSAIPFNTIRANEVSISTATGAGDEWVAIAWSSGIWDKVRDNLIMQQLISKGMGVEEVPQGTESIYVLTEGADPTVYTIGQVADVDATNRPTVNVKPTRPGTGRVLLTPGELGMGVLWSDVLNEDSMIAISSQYQKQMQTKAQETIEQLFINGDTATGANTNINLIDGTPATGLSTPYYIASDGALKYALVTGSGTSSAGSALTENDFRQTLKLFPGAIRSRKAQMSFIIDYDTHVTSLDIAAIKTDDVRRTNATIESGVLRNIYGVDVFESGMMPLANSAGKVPNAGGTLGRILGVYSPYFTMGWKRHITIETDRDIWAGTNAIVAKMRLGFVARGAGAAVARYNLTIA